MGDQPITVEWCDNQGRRFKRRAVKHDDGTVSFVSGSDPTSTPLGYVQLQVTAVAQNLPNIPQDATAATVVVEGAGVRLRKDGTDPTSTVGMPVPSGGVTVLRGAEIAAARFVQQSSGAILNVEYER